MKALAFAVPDGVDAIETVAMETARDLFSLLQTVALNCPNGDS
jgi:hypothetical protein